ISTTNQNANTIPTRRSSDLTIENQAETERKMHETVQSVEDRYDISEKITEERVEYIEEIFEAILKIEEQEAEDRETEEKNDKNLDRKSTRLNSSHVSISYAV